MPAKLGKNGFKNQVFTTNSLFRKPLQVSYCLQTIYTKSRGEGGYPNCYFSGY